MRKNVFCNMPNGLGQNVDTEMCRKERERVSAFGNESDGHIADIEKYGKMRRLIMISAENEEH